MNWNFMIPVELADEGGERWTTIFYVGDFVHAMYGEFKVTLKKLQHALKNIQDGVGLTKDEHGSHVMTANYNHGAYSANPEESKNSGLATKFRLHDGKLQAVINWTNKAKEYIENKEFMWISPEFTESYRDENNKEHGFTVTAVALCNRPFLKKGQLAVVATDEGNYFIQSVNADNGTNLTQSEVNNMELKEQLTTVLNLTEGQDVVEAVKALTEANAKLEKDVQDKDAEIKTLKESDKGLIKLQETEYSELKKNAEAGAEAAKKLAEKEVSDLVAKALTDKKIIPAQEKWFKGLAEKDIEQAKAYADATPANTLYDVPGSDHNEPQVDGDVSEQINAKAKELQSKDKTLSYVDAVNQVLASNPELEKQYNGE